MPNKPSNELELVQPAPMPVAQQPASGPVQANIGGMLQAVIQQGVTKDNVAALESLVKLYEHTCAMEAEREFARAFNALQAEMPKVNAVSAVHNNDGSVRYKFAPYEDIMAQVQPLLLKHGFTVSFSTRYDETRIVKICTLTHVGGHNRTNEFAVRIGKGPPGSSEAQGDGAAGTYAKRFALCDSLNIVVEKDSDARAEGGTITKEQADELEHRVAMLNADKRAFLAFAHATSFASIPAAIYPIADDFLRRKEQKGR